ncbi:MAG: hypothetical protein KA179_00075 [Sulfuritalea sp.]|nr:hypothetical protein [Sulfuritalea sp.]
MTTINDIEAAANRLARALDTLNAHKAVLERDIQIRIAGHLPVIIGLTQQAAEAHDALAGLLQGAPDLFDNPRSVAFHGIQLGYRKGKGELRIDDPERTMQRIRTLFPDQADTLIGAKYFPVKNAIAQLPAADLRKIGAELVATGDAPFIKPAPTVAGKLVDALIKGIEHERATAQGEPA